MTQITNSLQIAVVPEEFLSRIDNRMEKIEELLRSKNREELSSQWLSSVEARKMLGISQKTWQTYRNERRIPFSQNGRKIRVLRSDIEAYMQKHYINNRRSA